MTLGRHVTPEECREMREAHEQGYWIGLIAAEYDLSESGVKYHIYERCTHQPG
jgi:hypothetical protein